MKEALKTFLIYLPAPLAVVGIWFTCVTLTLPESIVPFTRPLAPVEDILEFRGLFGDTCVNLLAHLTVFLSSERRVRAAAKGFAALYCVRLAFLLPTRFIELAATDEYRHIIIEDAFRTNRTVIFAIASLHALGAAVLWCEGSDTRSQKTKTT